METEENEINFGFADAGTWNSTGHIALENMKIDAPMVITLLLLIYEYFGRGCLW